MSAIFISYRRDDTEGQAGRLFDELSQHFGHDAVFMDVAAIEPGRDFRQAIDEHVASCGVLLAVIGKGWLTARDTAGARRLDDPLDFVRLETASALKRDIPVVPVLVQGAHMPRAEDLPGDLQALAYRNAVELTHARWDSDVEVLVKALRSLVIGRANAPAVQPAVGGRTGRRWGMGLALAAALGLAYGAYTWHRHTTDAAAQAAAQLEQARRSAALAEEARRQAEADRANLEKLAAAQRAKSQADAEARWKAEAERAAAQRALSQAASKPAPPAATAPSPAPAAAPKPSTAPTAVGAVIAAAPPAAGGGRPTSTSAQAVAPRIRWRAGHFPPPNAGDLVYALLASGDPACASYDGRSCLWGTAEKDIEFARLRPLACGTAHKAVYGSTGYEDPRHWCNLARKTAAP